jgi:hypothetical protein
MVQSNSLNWLFSLFYAYLYIYIIPWTELAGGEFVDVYAYLERIVYLHEGGNEAEYWGIQWLMSEPLWKGMILLMGETFTDYRNALYLVSFVSVFLYTSFLLKRVEFYVAMIFLVTPMVVDLFLAQIRSALAFSIVLTAYNLSARENVSKLVPGLLLVIATLIHMSMPVFLGIYYLLYRLNDKVKDNRYYFFAMLTALIIALFMKYGSNLLLTAMGDRHAGYDEYISGSSVAYSIAWFIIAVLLSSFGDFSDKKNRVIVGYSITILSFFFFSSLLNIFAARYVALSMPAIIVAISFLPKHFKQGTYLFLLFYNIYSFKYWVHLIIL